MSFESDVSAAAFAPFAVACTLNGVPGKVIIDRNVEVIDDVGRVVDRVTQATFLRSFASSATHGQTLVVLPGEAGEETFTIGARESDDGHIVVLEVHK